MVETEHFTEKRIDRTCPPLNSGVPMSELTGPQRIEARAVDLISSKLLQLVGLSSEKPGELKKLSERLDEVTSLQTLRKVVERVLGDGARDFKISLAAEYGSFKDADPRAVPVYEAIAQFATEKPKAEENEGATLRRVMQKLAPIESQKTRKDWFTRVSKAGIRRGPGRYSQSRLPKSVKRHNGRGHGFALQSA